MNFDAGQLTAIEILPADDRSTSADGTGVDISGFIGRIQFTLSSEGKNTGDNDATLDIHLETSDELSANYTDVTSVNGDTAFTQVGLTAAFESIAVDTRNLKKYVRAVVAIAGGSSPAFISSVTAHGFKNVQS